MSVTLADAATTDRKSTRLNSSHLVISYAVFCLKKKNEFRKNSRQSFPIDANGGFSIDNVKGKIESHGWSSNGVVLDAAILCFFFKNGAATKINILSLPNPLPI